MTLLRGMGLTVLSAWAFSATPASAQTFAVGDTRLRFDEQGEGVPVVLVPGWSQSLETWDEQVPALREEFRVLRFDRGPWGQQSDPVDVLALMAHLDLRRAVVVGHSVGAPAALRLAANFPERVLALVLIGPPTAPGLGPWQDEDSWPAHLERLGVDPPNPFVVAADHGVDSLLTLAASHPLFRVPAGHEGVERTLQRIWGRYEGNDLTFTPPQPRTRAIDEENLSGLEVPTLILVGEDELGHFRRAARRLHDLLPESELRVVSGGGHMIHLINPTALNGLVLDFLETHVPRQSEDLRSRGE